MALDRNQVKAIQAEVHSAVEAVCARHGLAMERCNATYSDADIRFSVTVASKDPVVLADSARKKFGWQFKEYGIDYGAVVTTRNGKEYRVTGFTGSGNLETVGAVDGKVWTGKPSIFYLNGKKLESAPDKTIGADAAPTEAK